MNRWNPRVKCSEREVRLHQLAGKSRKLFRFLREQRHVLFSADYQEELHGMYRDHGQGDEPQPPALMCMALLLQGYLQVSDAEAVRLSATDSCWRMVLGTLERADDLPAFSQGGLQQFRERLIRQDMDRRLVERTVELAKQTKIFDWKKLPKNLRVAVDSRPLEGAGRVEDTINLLGHAGRKIAECIAAEEETSLEDVCQKVGAPLLAGQSVKATLDIDWGDPKQRTEALTRLCAQLDKLSEWLSRRWSPEKTTMAGAMPYVEALAEVKAQDVEPAPGGGVQIRQEVAPDRRISIEDAEMRHGRKSKSKRFNGYKQHISTDVDTGIVLACAVTPANRPEEEATPSLESDMTHLGVHVADLLIDRAYVNSALAEQVTQDGGVILCKPWKGNNGKTGLFGKKDFHIDIRAGTITCPAGQVEPFEPSTTVTFDPEVCGPCPLRSQCTHSSSGRGRSIQMGADEALQKKLRKLQSTPSGRAELRERVGVEHSLAHLANRQGPRARYLGVRKNTFDLRRLAAIQNLETIARGTSTIRLAA